MSHIVISRFWAVVIIWKRCLYIFEFKMDGSADEALQQIEQKGYAKPYATDPRHVLRIGMNFSSETRTIAEWKVVWTVATVHFYAVAWR